LKKSLFLAKFISSLKDQFLILFKFVPLSVYMFEECEYKEPLANSTPQTH
jgi:hypothetical protein